MIKTSSKRKRRCFTHMFRIANTVIKLYSYDPDEPTPRKHAWVLKNFLYTGAMRPHITLTVQCRRAPYILRRSQRLFFSSNPHVNGVSWSLYREKAHYIIACHARAHDQIACINRSFTNGTVYLAESQQTWNPAYIIYNILQVVLLNYLSFHSGIFIHAAGALTPDGTAVLFAGPPESGKSTIARMLHKDGNLKVINDDRVIVRRNGRHFMAYASPWHSSYNLYLKHREPPRQLERVFFIRRSKKNAIQPMDRQNTFRRIWSNLFISFWDKDIAARQIAVCYQLLSEASFYRLGLRRGRSAIEFIKSICVHTASAITE